MEFVNGGTLGTLLESRKLSEIESVCIMKQILEGIHYIHNKGMIHRDLKPQNILISSSQQLEGTVKIADFGLGTQGANSFIGRCGTLIYMAPEQLEGEKCHKVKKGKSVGS
jgi:serine/threonine protein kinase